MCYCTVFAVLRVQTPRGVYLEGRFIGGFFALRVGGGGLIFEGAYFPNFTVYGSNQSTYKCSIIFEDAYYIHECILH